MILTRSPYYKTIAWDVSAEKYILEIYVWKGLKADVPVSPTYEIENKNPLARSGDSKVNISNLINDDLTIGLESDTITNVIDSNSAVWVKTQVIDYINGVAQTPRLVTTDLAIKGYGYGIEGENTTIPSNNILAYGSSVNVSYDSNFTLPIKVSEVASVDVTVISYPSNEINKSFTISATTNSNELIKNVFVKCSECINDTSIQIDYEGVIYELILKEELRYNPIDIWYLNKYGQLYSLTFFKDKTESLKVENEMYESSNGQPINGIHQYERFNTTGKSEFKVKSGFLKETNNEIFKQLFLSNKIWQFNGTTFIPLNLNSKSLEYKTRQRDRLISYEIDFEYAFSELNNI
jgi:hypothetical protein